MRWTTIGAAPRKEYLCAGQLFVIEPQEMILQEQSIRQPGTKTIDKVYLQLQQEILLLY